LTILNTTDQNTIAIFDETQSMNNMKRIIREILLAALTVLFMSHNVRAQIDIEDILNTRKFTREDSIKLRKVIPNDSTRLALMHYLIGAGIKEGKGIFVKDRKVYIDSILRIAPASSSIWFGKSYPLIIAGKYEIGMPYMDSAVKYNRAGLIGRRGYMKCIFQKHYREAIIDMQTAKELEHGPGQVEDHPYDFFIGLCYLQLNNFDSSEYLFRNSINKVMKDHGYGAVNYLELFYLGVTLFEKDDCAAAITCFDSCLSQYPVFSDAKFYKAWCLNEQEQYEPARELMKDARKDFLDGNTINDDNAHVEPYPYQVNKYHIDESIGIFERKVNAKPK
jgi:tetratricopeptide (TPR) repeat protein